MRNFKAVKMLVIKLYILGR